MVTARADQLRPLNLPQPVTVKLDNSGLPMTIGNTVRPDKEEDNSEPTDYAPYGRAVETIIETWHIDDEWWRQPISRRYVEVILEGGKHVVLYEDLTGSSWYMQKP
jgi:hypothetical protein